MPNKITEYGDGNWNWRTTSPFSQAIEIGDQIFISGQQALTEGGELVAPNDIAGQTRCVFENMKAVLERAGLDLSDLVRLNTYYVFDGADEDATEYWEAMTRVRLEYFPDPGPAATAVRIKGMPYQGQLIQIEGIALRGAARAIENALCPAAVGIGASPCRCLKVGKSGIAYMLGVKFPLTKRVFPSTLVI